MNQPVIPIFFACDDAYAPFLGVALTSILENASPAYFYRVHILTSGFRPSVEQRLLACKTPNSEICMENMTARLKAVAASLHTRDYYSVATYYRLFIAEIFTQYDKVLYIDADTVVPGDVAELYNTRLGNHLVAAVQEDVMSMEPIFGRYVEEVLGVPRGDYFNAGVLVMNLRAFRAQRIQAQFLQLLQHRRFVVTQDQDYLNVLCRHHVKRLGWTWNKTPCDRVSGPVLHPSLVHFKLLWRPWKDAGLPYEDLFWQYADKSSFAAELRAMQQSYSAADRMQDLAGYRRLMRTAQEAIDDCKSAERALYEAEAQPAYGDRVCAI